MIEFILWSPLLLGRPFYLIIKYNIMETEFTTLSSPEPQTLNGFSNYEEISSVPRVPIENYEPKKKKLHFLETTNADFFDFEHLRNDCIIPVFSKDNEKTIAHPVFIQSVHNVAKELFQGEIIEKPEIIVSHLIKGRVPGASDKDVRDLLPQDETKYYERMAFSFEIPSIHTEIGGNLLNLTVTGVRAYNHENLSGKKSMERFSVAIGFRNQVCCNLCTFTDGYKSDLTASTPFELQQQVTNLFQEYEREKHLTLMKAFNEQDLSEHQFAQFIGKTRLYQNLPSSEKKTLPILKITDSQINDVAKNYYADKNFKRANSGRITLWCVYNLLTGANKKSYIDNYLDRSANAFQLTQGLSKAIAGDPEYKWFVE